MGECGHMPLLLSVFCLTTAGLIYNPLGAWLHDKVNSRRGMYLVGLVGCLVTTFLLAAITASYSGTTNRAGSAMGIFFIFLYLAFQGACCNSTMYIYISEIFPTELRPIGIRSSYFRPHRSESHKLVGSTI
jgi:MFS family permease